MALATKQHRAQTDECEIIPPRAHKTKPLEQDNADAASNGTKSPRSCLRYKSLPVVCSSDDSPSQKQASSESRASDGSPKKSALKQKSCDFAMMGELQNTKTEKVDLNAPATEIKSNQSNFDYSTISKEENTDEFIDLQRALASLRESSQKSRDLLKSIYDGTYVAPNSQKRKVGLKKASDASANDLCTTSEKVAPKEKSDANANDVIEKTSATPPQHQASDTKVSIRNEINLPQVDSENVSNLPASNPGPKKSAMKGGGARVADVSMTVSVDNEHAKLPPPSSGNSPKKSALKNAKDDSSTSFDSNIQNEDGRVTRETSSARKANINEDYLTSHVTGQSPKKSALKTSVQSVALPQEIIGKKANITEVDMKAHLSGQTPKKSALKTSVPSPILPPETQTRVDADTKPSPKKSAMKNTDNLSSPSTNEYESTSLPPSPEQMSQMSKSLTNEFADIGDGGSASDEHPLKEIMTARKGKIDADRLRKALEGMTKDDAKRWLDAPLDSMLPSALFFAIGATLSDIVSMLLDFGVNPQKPYDGKKMYQGWIKCGSTPSEAVTNRKGRFVGTMLGDRLEEICQLLKLAETRVLGAAAAEGRGDTQDTQLAEKQALEKQSNAKGDRGSRKRRTVQLDSVWGTIEHTQGDPSERYDMVSVLEGVFTPIRVAIHKLTGEKRAIKAEMKVDEEIIWEEVTILRKVHHQHVIQLYETYEDAKHIYVVLEICNGGEMFKRLFREGGINAGSASRLMHQCALAIEYIHSVNICHRDIQPENFLLKENGPLWDAQIKLIDFSRAKEFGPDLEMKTKICNVFFVAPEVLSRKEAPYTEKVDIWSLGVVFFLMFCGVQPFNGETELATLKKVKRGAFTFSPEDIWRDVNDEAKNLIQAMLVVKPESRLSASSVAKHPWVNPAIKKRLSAEQATLVSAAQLCKLRNFSARDRLDKVVFSMQQQELPQDGMKALASAFRKLDKQNNGRVHISQLRDKIRRIATISEQSEEIMRVLWNLGSDGIVSFDMFVNGMIERHRTLQKETCKAIFDVVDYNGDGTISPECLENAISHDDGNLRSSSSTLKIGLELVFGLPVDDVKKLLSENQPCHLSNFYDLMNRQSNFENILTT